MTLGVGLTRRQLAVLLVSALAVSAAGFGVLDLGTGSGPSQADTPAPPDVSPPTNTTETPGTPPDGTTTAVGTTTAPGTTTSTTTMSTTTPTGSVSIDFRAGNPNDVQTTTGVVRTLYGPLTGTVAWDVSNASTLTVVVSTWTPDHGWATKRTVTRNVTDAGSVALEALVDNPVVYADGERADDYSNPTDGTTVVREGYVVVTAFVSTGDRVVERQSMQEYTFAVTNLAEQSGTPGLSVDDSGLLSVENAAPGLSGSSETVVTNTGDAAGALDVVLKDVASSENGLIEPELEVDEPGDGGELADALDVRIALVRADGTRTYVVGGSDSFVSLATLDESVLAENYRLDPGESVRVVAEWRISSAVGNAIQTDTVSINVTYVLTST